MTKKFFEDFHLGPIETKSTRTLSKESIERFAQEYDRLPFHLNEESGKASIYKGLIASGLQTLSLTAAMVVDDILIDSSMTGGLGMTDVRWLKPVRPGDCIRVNATVIETEPLPKQPAMGRVRMGLEVLNQTGIVVMTSKVDYLFMRRNNA
jgi:acyl dehydratase